MAHVSIGGNDPERMLRIAKTDGATLIGNNNATVLTLPQVLTLLQSLNAFKQRSELVAERTHIQQVPRAAEDVARDAVASIKELRSGAREKLNDLIRISRDPDARNFKESMQEQFLRLASNREIVADLLVLQFSDSDVVDLCKKQIGNGGITDAARAEKIADLSAQIAEAEKVIAATSNYPGRFNEEGHDLLVGRAALASFFNFYSLEPCDHAGRVLKTKEWMEVLKVLEIKTGVSQMNLFRPGKESRWDLLSK